MTTAPEWYVITPITRNQLLNNGCLLKTVHPGGERGVLRTTPLSSFTPKEDNNQIRLG